MKRLALASLLAVALASPALAADQDDKHYATFNYSYDNPYDNREVCKESVALAYELERRTVQATTENDGFVHVKYKDKDLFCVVREDGVVRFSRYSDSLSKKQEYEVLYVEKDSKNFTLSNLH